MKLNLIHDEEQLIIRESKKKQYGYLTITGLIIVWYFVGPYDKTRVIYSKSPIFTIILGLIMFSLFFYFLNELIKRKAEIILTKKGIELRDKGYFDWQTVESFKTVYYRYSDTYYQDLVLHLKGFADLKFDISHLEKDKTELVDLILKYKGPTGIFYLGHEVK